MEHRHSPRKTIDLKVQLSTNEGITYHAQILELSTVGMRVVMHQDLPERIKVVEVALPGSIQCSDSKRCVRMFVVHRVQRELGLCLVNERARMDVVWKPDDDNAFSGARKVAS